MVKKLAQNIILPLVALAFSIVLFVVSSSAFFDNLLLYVFKEKSLPSVKFAIELLNYIVLVFPLGIQAVASAYKASKYYDLSKKFNKNQITLITSILKENDCILDCGADINIRIFKKANRHLVLEEKLGAGATKISGKLSFSIKDKQGLCSMAYNDRRSMLEIEDSSQEKYHLTQRQKALAGNLKFIVAVPICQGTNDNINYVVCYDSMQKIAKKGQEQKIIKICEEHAYYLISVIM